MKKTSWICLFLAFSSLCKVCAQKQTVSTKKRIKEAPKFQFADPRPKFFQFTYQNLPSSSNLISTGGQAITFTDLKDDNRLVSAKLRVPLIIKGKATLIGEAGFKNERSFFGETVAQPVENPLKLNNLNIGLIGEYDLPSGNQLGFYARGSIRSDDLDINDGSQYSYTFSAIYQFRRINNQQLGLGLYASSAFGRVRVFPSVLYKKSISDRLILDAMLPKDVSLTYRVNDRLNYVAELSAEGSSYLITRATLDGYGALEYRRSHIGLAFGIEKLLCDMAGVSITAGVAQPLNAVLVEPGKPTRDRVWTFDQTFTPFIKVSLFAVPPSKLWSRAVN